MQRPKLTWISVVHALALKVCNHDAGFLHNILCRPDTTFEAWKALVKQWPRCDNVCGIREFMRKRFSNLKRACSDSRVPVPTRHLNRGAITVVYWYVANAVRVLSVECSSSQCETLWKVWFHRHAWTCFSPMHRTGAAIVCMNRSIVLRVTVLLKRSTPEAQYVIICFILWLFSSWIHTLELIGRPGQPRTFVVSRSEVYSGLCILYSYHCEACLQAVVRGIVFPFGL